MSIKDFIGRRILRATGEKLNGKKSIISGVGMILLGIAGIIHNVFPDQPGLPELSPTESWLSITGGIGIIGVAGKADKITNALKGGKKK